MYVCLMLSHPVVVIHNMLLPLRAVVSCMVLGGDC